MRYEVLCELIMQGDACVGRRCGPLYESWRRYKSFTVDGASCQGVQRSDMSTCELYVLTDL